MKKEYVFYLLISIFFAFTYYYTFDSKLDLNGDNARYLMLAKNLSEGLGYSDITPDGARQHAHFPAGYPAFLSLFMLLGIKNLVFLKVLNGLLFLVTLLLLFYLTNKLTKNTALAFACALLPVFVPQLLHFSSIVMSEMLFMFLSVLCLFCLYRYSISDKTSTFLKSPWIYFAIVAAIASYYVRAVGLATIFALIVFFLPRKEWKQALVSVAGSFLLILPLAIHNKNVNSGTRYIDAILSVNHWRPEEGTISTFGDLVGKLMKNADEAIIKGFKEVLFPFASMDYSTSSDIGGIITGLLVLAIVFYGAWKSGGLRWAVIAFLAGNIGMIIIGTGGNGSRYIIPITPLIYACFYSGLYAIVRKFILKKENAFSVNIPYAFLILACFMFSPVKSLAAQSRQPYPPAYQHYFRIAQEMQKQLSANKVICCCRKPELFMYYAPDIYATNYSYSTEPDDVVRDLIRKKVNYVILEQLGYSSTSRYLLPAIVKHQELFPQMWHLQSPDTFLLGFDRQKAIEKLGTAEK